MGQLIVVQQPVFVGDVAVFVTDRALAGVGTRTFESAVDAEAQGDISAKLAARLFAIDAGLRQLTVTMNTVVVRRVVGWNDAQLGAVARTIEELFVFYPVDGPI